MFIYFTAKRQVCLNGKGRGNADGVRIGVFEPFLSDLKIEITNFTFMLLDLQIDFFRI